MSATTNPLVRRMFRELPPGPAAPAALGETRSLSDVVSGGSCGFGTFLGDMEHNDAAVFTHATSLGSFAAILALGGAGAGLLLAGRPISGAVIGLAAGAGVTFVQFRNWKANGGKAGTPGACG